VAQSYNMSEDATAAGTGSLTGQVPSAQFVSLTPGSEDLHLRAGAPAIDAGTSLAGSFTNDVDGDTRPLQSGWDMGADEAPLITITVDNASATEGGGLLFTVTLDSAAPAPFTVSVTLAEVTATGGAAPLVTPEDYNNVVAALNFAGTLGETEQFTVNTLDDVNVEGPRRSVLLGASDPRRTRIPRTGTINDNDTALIRALLISAPPGSIPNDGSTAPPSRCSCGTPC
jgi:hypothetical protein